MKRLLLLAICYLPVALFAQTSQTGSDYIARRLQVPLLDAPQRVSNASVSVSGNPGPATYFYWIVTNGLIGASSPAGPFQIGNAPNTLTGSNFNQISWSTALGGVNFDVLRTSTPGPPFGACNCAVATAVAGNSTNDQANALNAYTVNTFDPSTVLWTITNESVSGGVSQITFRANGFAKFSLVSNGGAVALATPFTAPAHQFFTAFSGGGVFSAAQPASADIRDGTGTGVVARQTNAALASPTTTGTDNGTETIQNKTLASPAFTGTESGMSITSPSMTSPTINTGVSSGSGLKHQRFGATCTTTATAFATCNTTYSWTAAFADANYTPVCTAVQNLTNVAELHIASFNAGGVTVTVESLNSAGATVGFSGVDCVAIHD